MFNVWRGFLHMSSAFLSRMVVYKYFFVGSHCMPIASPSQVRPSAEQLLADFQKARREDTPLPDVVMQTLNSTLGPGVADIMLEMPLGQALMRLSHAVQKETSAQSEQLDYHNVAHFREAVMSAGHLAALEFEGQKACPHMVVLAMTAMVGHDFKHDGTSNTPDKCLEAVAWDACKPHMEGVHPEDMAALESIILCTDPLLLNEQRSRYASVQSPATAIDKLRLLACEADLTPSLMPVHGVAMGKLFAAELNVSGVPKLEKLGETLSSWESRMGFLKHATPISTAAKKFGLAHIHDSQLKAFSALTDSLGMVGDKETTQHLDGLERSIGAAHAGEVYMAALAHVDGPLAQTVCKTMGLPHPAPLQQRLSFGM